MTIEIYGGVVILGVRYEGAELLEIPSDIIADIHEGNIKWEYVPCPPNEYGDHIACIWHGPEMPWTVQLTHASTSYFTGEYGLTDFLEALEEAE